MAYAIRPDVLPGPSCYPTATRATIRWFRRSGQSSHPNTSQRSAFASSRRNFGPLDTLDSPRVAIVNQSMARRYWPTGSAVGQRFRIGSLTGPEHLIVGVSADYKVRTVGEPPTPYIHFAQSQRLDDEWTILVKSRAGFSAPVEAVHRVLANLEPDLLFRANSMDAKLATVLLPASAAAYSLGIAGTMAMLFAAIGLYGVVAFMVAQRTHEFGVRLALGVRLDRLSDSSCNEASRWQPSASSSAGSQRRLPRRHSPECSTSRSRRSARLADGVCCGD